MSFSRFSNLTIVPQAIELETSGQFYVVDTPDDSNRCGPIGAPRVIQYRVVIQSAPEYLSGQGFIIDWLEIRKYFGNRWGVIILPPGGRDTIPSQEEQDAAPHLPYFPSCEELAATACGEIVGMLEGRCNAVTVYIGSGAMPTGMSARWTREG